MKKQLFAAIIAGTMIAPAMTKPVSAKTVTISAKSGKDKKDDTKAIQKALDSNKSGTVVIPKGTYYSKVLYLRGNTTLKLSKGTVMKRIPFKAHPEDAWVIFHPKKKGYTGFNKITITGGTWDGQVHKNNKTSEHKGFELDHGQNVTITNTTLKNMSGMHMIEVNASKNVTVDHVTFKNQYFYSGKNHSHVAKYSPATCEALQFDSAKRGAAFALPYDNTVCQNYTITNNKFINVQSGLGTHHNEKSYWKYMHKNITVSNNTFTKLKADAIHMNNVDTATLSGNRADGGNQFMTFYHASNITTSGNVADKFKTPYQVADTSTNVKSDGDTFTHTKDSASPAMSVFVNGNSDLTMNNATIASKKKGAVVVNDSALTLTNSRLTSAYTGSYGIVVNRGKNITLTGNDIKGHTDGWGVVVKGAQSFNADSNRITSFAHGMSVLNTSANINGTAMSVSGNGVRFEKATASLTNTQGVNGSNFISVAGGSTVNASHNACSGFQTPLMVTGDSTAKVDSDAYTSVRDSSSPKYSVFVDGNSSLDMTNSTIDSKKQGAVNVESGNSLNLDSSNITCTNYSSNYGITAHNAGTISVTNTSITGKHSANRPITIQGCGNLTMRGNRITGYAQDVYTTGIANMN